MDTVVFDRYVESETWCQMLRRPHNPPAFGCCSKLMQEKEER